MSSGLVASMALPAHAVDNQPEAAGPVTASIPVIPADGAGSALFTAPAGGLLSLPLDLATDSTAVAAPAAATVDFDHSAFTLEPAGQVRTDWTATPDDDQSQDAPQSQTDAPEKAVTKPAPPKRKDLRLTNSISQDGASTKQVTPKTSSDSSSDSSAVAESSIGSKVVAIAFRYEGTPYLWGGTTPRGFDCSGFTKYVYAQVGKDLGRTVAAQRGDVKFVKRSQAKPGDLVIFGTGHIGIFLGKNRMIDAPRRGKTIQAREIYSSNVQFGRVV